MEKFEQASEQQSELGEIIDKIDKTNVTVYEKLNASNDKAAKAEFLENPNLIHPNNEYGNLNEDEVRKNLEELDSIEQGLESSWMSDKEKRAFYEKIIKEVNVHEERQPNGQWLKSIVLRLPLIEHNMTIRLDNGSYVETVCLLQKMSNTRERTITLDVEMEDYHRIKNRTEVTADATE